MPWNAKSAIKRSVAAKKRPVKKVAKDPSFSKRVRQVIARVAETKVATLNWQNVCYPACLQGTANTNGLSQNIISMCPTLPVGGANSNLPTGSCIAGPYVGVNSGQGYRVGNRLQPKRVLFKYNMSENGYNATTFVTPQPCYVKFFLVKGKESPLIPPTQAQLGGVNGIFFQGGGAAFGFNGTPMDIIQDVNHDDYTLLAEKTFKVGPANYSGTGSNGAFEYFQNNDFKIAEQGSWDITKYMPKVMKFDDNGNSTSPTVWLIMQVVPAVAALSFNAAQLPITLDYQIIFEYQDV